MTKRTEAFITVPRKVAPKRSVEERIKDFREIDLRLSDIDLQEQAERCMDCGVPFCHAAGCPLGSSVPAWNAAVNAGQWDEALELLLANNPFAEITGRVCPAPCEYACTLSVHGSPVTVRQIELAIVEHGFSEGWIFPRPPVSRTHRRVAVIGSGPAGLAAAHALNRYGHSVTVFEKADRFGGILRYGIPDFKLDKSVLDRRIKLLREEGIEFLSEVEAGKDLSARYLLKYFDAICLTGGAEAPRRLDIPGSDLDGVHLAMEYLTQQNRVNAGDPVGKRILAKDKTCLILGGGDTGDDCVGTARRQGAKAIYQFELLPKPPASRTADMPWPSFARMYKKTSSQEEGCIQRWNVLTKELRGNVSSRVTGLKAVEVDWSEPDPQGRRAMRERPETVFEMHVDLVILALGFTGPIRSPLLADLGVTLTDRGAIWTDGHHRTSVPGVYCAGDIELGPSLVVHAIRTGREAAESIHAALSGSQ